MHIIHYWYKVGDEDKSVSFSFFSIWGIRVGRRYLMLREALVLSPTQEGTLFEADFYLLDGIKANVICNHQQHLAAPLVMLKLQPDGQLLPMAIQVRGLGISAPCWLAVSNQPLI